jgi:ribosomal protein S1
MKAYLQTAAKPGTQITAGALRNAVIDGVAVTDAAVKIGGGVTGIVPVTVMQYPYIGEVAWE